MLFFVVATAHAQDRYLNVGYHFGNLGNGVNSFKNEVYALNSYVLPNVSKSLKYPNFTRGINVEFLMGNLDAKSFYFCWNWSNNHVIASGKGVNATGGGYDYSLKYRHNNFTITTFGYKINNWLGLAYSPVDIGKLKVLYKNSDDPETKKYDEFYNNLNLGFSDYTIYGASYYLDLFLKNRVKARLSYYRSYGGVAFTDKDNILTSHYYNANRLNFNLIYQFNLSK